MAGKGYVISFYLCHGTDLYLFLRTQSGGSSSCYSYGGSGSNYPRCSYCCWQDRRISTSGWQLLLHKLLSSFESTRTFVNTSSYLLLHSWTVLEWMVKLAKAKKEQCGDGIEDAVTEGKAILKSFVRHPLSENAAIWDDDVLVPAGTGSIQLGV